MNELFLTYEKAKEIIEPRDKIEESEEFGSIVTQSVTANITNLLRSKEWIKQFLSKEATMKAFESLLNDSNIDINEEEENENEQIEILKNIKKALLEIYRIEEDIENGYQVIKELNTEPQNTRMWKYNYLFNGTDLNILILYAIQQNIFDFNKAIGNPTIEEIEDYLSI